MATPGHRSSLNLPGGAAATVLPVALAALAVMLVAACGGNSDEGGGAESTDPTEAVAAADPAAADVAASLQDGGEADDDRASVEAEADGGGAGDQIEPVLDPLDIRGEIISEFSLTDGECFNRFESLRAGRRLTVTSRIDCAEPHLAEVYHTFEIEAEHPAVYPGTEAVRSYALTQCYEQFEAFVGQSYELSVYEIDVFTPTRTNFEHEVARYRGVHCWLHHTDDEPLLGSARGTAL